MKDKIPQVLVLGNGLLRSYGDLYSWDKLLKDIHCNEKIDKDMPLDNISYPLEIVLRTDDNVDVVLKNQHKELYGNTVGRALYEKIDTLLGCKFDYILTTNYGYEIESVALGKTCVSDRELIKYRTHSKKIRRAESKDRLYTYYGINGNNIWHIHGEARSYSSIILGHYYYGNLLAKCHAYLKNKGNDYEERQISNQRQEIHSWLDAFILGDIYMLGLGMDFSEMDLWWLLNRKKREKANVGSVYFFEPSSNDFCVKHELLKCYGVEVVDFDMTLRNADMSMSDSEINTIRAENDKLYDKFYCKAIDEMKFLQNGDS